MQLFFGVFLIFASAGAIAQSGTASDTPGLPDAARESPKLVQNAVTSTSIGTASLPDAPSYVTHQTSRSASYSPVSKQLLSSAASNSAIYPPLVFAGGTSSAKEVAAPQQFFDGPTAASRNNCGSNSNDKKTESGWFNSLISATSKSGHYCALGEGGLWKRGTYAIGRAFVAHKYDNAASFTNPAEFFAPGLTRGASANFNPYQAYAYRYDAGQRLATRYASAVGRDTLKNMIREFWPDISSHMHRRP